MKRAWTKKVKSLPSCAVGKDALKGKLQPQTQGKRRIFRTSAAMIGLTVSIGTPNLLLAQAAQLPEGISSDSAPTKDSAAPETVQTVVAGTFQVAFPASDYRSTAKQTAAQGSDNQPALVVQPRVPETNYSTPELQSSSQIVAQAPVVEPVQNQQASLEPNQAIVTPAATASQTQEAIAPLKSIQAETPQSQAIEVVTTQINSNSSLLELQPVEVAVVPEANSALTAKQRLLVNRLKIQGNPAPLNQEQELQPVEVAVIGEANSALTAKQRLLVNRLKIQGNPAPLNQEQELQVSSNVNLPLPTTPSPSEREQLANEVPVVESQGSLTEVIVLPTTGQSSQDLVTPSEEIAQPSPAITNATEQLAPAPQPVFVLPEVSVAPQVDTTSIEVKEVVEQQPAAQETPETVEISTPSLAEVPRVNEPIIVSSITSEYQVKPGDTLTNIASEHRLSLPEIANFNHLPDPDLLLVDQRLKIPTLPSIKAQANVAVLPPIEVEQLADANNLSVPVPQPEIKVAQVSTNSPAYTGVGGSVAGEAEAKPLEQAALNDLQAQYIQKLQNDVQKLKHRYYAQNRSKPIVTAQAVKSEVLPELIKPSSNLTDEPVNPEFRVISPAQDLKPVTQKQLLNRVKYTAPASIRSRVATAPANIANEDSFSVRQVSPELPPLDPAWNYLPQPDSVAPFNGYIWPAKGALTSKYGYRWGRMHRGIDIAAPVGTPIFAAAPGVVIKSGWNKGGYGNLVDIQHADGTLTRYAHNYRLLVQPGQFVDQGQQISLMGNTGRSTGPHLHFEVHPGGKGAVNPIALLPKAR